MGENKYYGPDKYKGVRPTGHDKYYGPNKYKGVRQPKKSSGSTTTKPKKANSLLEQAKELGTSKYAPVLAEIEGNKNNNITLYNNATAQRRNAVNREIGSISAAGATTRKRISDAGVTAQEAYLKANEGNKQNTAELMAKVQSSNDSMLSSLQAEMKARGASPEDYLRLSPVTQDMSKTNETLAALGKLRSDAVTDQALNAGNSTNRLSAMTDMQENSAKSSARGAAQANFDELYTKFLDKKGELDTAKTKAELEKQDYINQTYLTLKEKKAAEKAAAAQAKLQAQIASGNLNYKYASLKVNTQYKYDKLASDRAQKDIENRLKEKGFSHKKAVDLAKLALQKAGSDLAIDKFNWEKVNPKSSTKLNLADLLAAGN